MDLDISKHAAGPDSYDALSAFQISQFFENHVPTTKDGCDQLAVEILNCPVSPTPVQGGASYTVAPTDPEQASKVVQFRPKPLDMERIELVRKSYGDFFPDCKHHGTMSGDVHVYVLDLVPGPAYCRVRRQFLAPDVGMEQRLYRIVEDFARSVYGWTYLKPAT